MWAIRSLTKMSTLSWVDSALLTDIRVVCEYFAGAHPLAYFAGASKTEKKGCFIRFPPVLII